MATTDPARVVFTWTVINEPALCCFCGGRACIRCKEAGDVGRYVREHFPVQEGSR